MPAAEIISGKVVNQAALTAVTMATGDSLAIRSFGAPNGAYLLNMWAQQATAGTVRVRSPRMHDNVQNIREAVVAATPQPLLSDHIKQPLFSQDLLTLEQAGGGAETDAVSLFLYYSDVQGLAARLFRWAEIVGRITNVMTLELAIASGVTLGDYVGSTALSAATGQMEANVDYAILGYLSSAAVCSVGIRGQDTGNVRIGGPGTTQRIETREWFVQQSFANDLPLIPVINAANAAGTLVDVVQTGANTNPTVDLIMAQLVT